MRFVCRATFRYLRPAEEEASVDVTDIWALISSVVTVASIVVRITPTDADNKALAKVLRVLDVVSINKQLR